MCHEAPETCISDLLLTCISLSEHLRVLCCVDPSLPPYCLLLLLSSHPSPTHQLTPHYLLPSPTHPPPSTSCPALEPSSKSNLLLLCLNPSPTHPNLPPVLPYSPPLSPFSLMFEPRNLPSHLLFHPLYYFVCIDFLCGHLFCVSQ